MMKKKRCSACKRKLGLVNFHIDKSRSDGLSYKCKKCQNTANKKSYLKYLEKRLEKYKKYHQTLVGYLRHIFRNAKRRCINPEDAGYKHYGGRGIRCLFKSADEFVDYVINVLKIDPRGLQIDRINNNGHYEPGNIRFVTRSENLKNRRTWSK